MNDSAINITNYDIKDEMNIQDNDANIDESFFSKKREPSQCVAFNDNDANNISVINNNTRDMNAIGMSIEDSLERSNSKKVEENVGNDVKLSDVKRAKEKEEETNYKNKGVNLENKLNMEIKIVDNIKNADEVKNDTTVITTPKVEEDIVKPTPLEKEVKGKSMKISKSIASFGSKGGIGKSSGINTNVKSKASVGGKTTQTLPKNSVKSTKTTTANKTNDASKSTTGVKKTLVKSNTVKVLSSTKSGAAIKKPIISTTKTPTSKRSTLNSKSNMKSSSKSTNPFKPAEANLIPFQDYLTHKMENVVDAELQSNFLNYLQKFIEMQKDSEKEIETYNEELLDYIQGLYEEKIQRINEVNGKYEYDLPKLKDLVDLDNPNNVNNIIFKAVLSDKENDLLEIEEEFKRKKEEGIMKFKSQKKEKEVMIEGLNTNKLEEIKKEFSSDLRNKIFECLSSNDEMKRVDFSCIDLRSSMNKKVDFNSTVNTTVFNNTTMPMEVGRKTISYKKR